MLRPILAEGDAPAAPAAVCLAAGVFLGAWSGSGGTKALILMAVSAGALAGLKRLPSRGAPRPSAARRLAFFAFWLAAGFWTGRARIATPAAEAREAFGAAAKGGDAAAAADVVEGVLADFWSGEPPRALTSLRAERLLGPRGWVGFPAEVVVFLSGESPALPVADRGDRVRLTGRLEPEDLPASDRDLPLPWPRFRLSVKSARLVEARRATALSIVALPNRVLFHALTRAHGAPGDAEIRGALAALLLGRTAELDRGMIARFRRGGLYHLLVVSGLHVLLGTGLAAMTLSAARIGGRLRDGLLLTWVTMFVLIGGANPPAVRAGLVIGIFLVSRLLERPITGAQAAGLSALALLLAAPRELFSIGTALTFAAVLGIAGLSAPIAARLPSRPRWFFGGLAAALAAQCATAPILLWRFNLVAAAAWLTAPLAVPLSGALIGVGGSVLLLDAAGLPSRFPAMLFEWGVRLLTWTAERAAGVAFLRPTPPLWGVVGVITLLVLAVRAPAGLSLRKVSAVLACAAFLALAVRPGPAGPREGFSIEALDVGQGDAILLRWKRHAILVDGGGPFDLGSTDFGRTRLVPKLLDRGVVHLDAVVLTHPHPDHALGLFAVLEELSVSAWARETGEDEGNLSARLDALAARRGVPFRPLQDGDVLELDGSRLTVLHAGGRRRKTDAVNNQSVVALFERGGRSALLTGDAGVPTETDLLEAGALTPIDVLKVGHHGSRTSTSPEFLAALSPRAALLSCGRHNRFGHPAPETVATLGRFCVPVLRTDLRSDCRIELGPAATRLSWRGISP